MKKLLLETNLSKIYVIVMVLVSLFLLGGYFSYAMFTVSKEKKNAISIVTGNLKYDLQIDDEKGNNLVVPANNSKVFIITLSNVNDRIARFNFYYLKDLPSNVEAGYILDCETNKMAESEGVNLNKANSPGSKNIYKIIVTNESNNEISIELGVNVGLDYNDLKLPSDGHLFKEYENKPNPPELDDNMIAVTYNEGNWIKADINNLDNSWYNYNEQKWANAVTVTASTRSRYLNSEIGTIISIADIETFWVWIPRYSYTIGSIDGKNHYGKKGCYLEINPTQELPGEIDILFTKKNVKYKENAKYEIKTGPREYYTPDAFTFGDTELSGIWVGKFETSSSNPNAQYGGGNTTSLDPLVKPNVISWRNISVGNAFNISLKMNDTGNRYGFTTKVDTHMMKNSEWAAVSYLSQSKYGKLGNSNFTSINKEVYQNKANSFLTGCSSGTPSNGNIDYGCQYTYDIDINGTGASTTGNIYGIYDMSGGAWEYMMANYNDVIGGSEFSKMPDEKYYNKYTTENILTACNNSECLSHGLSETLGWYNDGNYMLKKENPWLLRSSGHEDETRAGIYFFSRGIVSGYPVETISFRLTLSL